MFKQENLKELEKKIDHSVPRCQEREKQNLIPHSRTECKGKRIINSE